MRVFLAEDNPCAQNLLKLVSHGNAILAEVLRLKDHIPTIYLLDSKELQQKYQDVILDFSYFKISDQQEKKINTNVKLQDLDDDLKEKYLELITRFYLLFENIYQYIIDLNTFVEQLNDGAFIQQTIDTVMKDVEGKQLLCESLYLYGSMLLLCDLYIPGQVRERLLVAFYRYSTSQSQSNVDDVCKLLRDTGYDQMHLKKPSDYPVEFFCRVPIHPEFVEKVVGKLRSEDIYNQLAVYTIPEHQASALATQASMLVVCLFFTPHYLHNDTTKMREIADKFFPCNWIVPVYMGVTLNLVDFWENFKAAKNSLHNTCNNKMVKDIFGKRGNSVQVLITKMRQLLKEGTLTDDFVLDNISKILNIIINSNHVLRWLILHNSDVIFFDTNKKGKQLRDLVLKETNYDPLNVLELLITTAELELKVREFLQKLLESKNSSWETNKSLAIEALNNLSELFSSSKPFAKISQNERLKLWIENIGKQVSSLGDPFTSKSIKKVTQLIQALDEVEEFHGIKSTSTILQFLSEGKDSLRNLIRLASLKEDSLVTLETVADFSYAWCTIDLYTKYMQNSIKENPVVTSRLRALFLKIASAMEIPLLRINQAQSEDLVSVSQYYSNELIRYIQKVLQIIPEMVFNIVEKIIDLQTWTIKEVPTRIEKEKLREYAQLEHRMEIAKLTHSASTFTTGILDMRTTLVGVIRVDPAELLEEGLLRELDTHISKKFNEFLEPQGKKPDNLITRLQKLSDSMDGYKRSLEYIQDYINIHGLRIWQKQVSTIINNNVNKEISLRKGVSLYGPSAGFMGSLARQVANLIDSRVSAYINICTAWYDVKTQKEVVNTKTFAKLNDAIGVVGLHGLDILYAFMIKNQLQNIQVLFRNPHDKFTIASVNLDPKEVEQVVAKCTKIIQQITDALLLIGGLQLLRKHVSYQLNTTCKFDSAHLEASLRTMNEALLSELKSRKSDPQNIPLSLIHDLDEYLVRCGINSPSEKVYIKHAQEFSNTDMGRIMAIVLISQLSKLQICYCTGDLITRKPGENIDGFPLLVGIYTLLRQSKMDSIDVFIDTLCSYAKVSSLAKLKTTEVSVESAFIMRILQLFCETFNYEFEKMEDKLPLAMLNNVHVKL
ncbi:PREDICTED: WASH complex subunit strumpellin isoform X1 [Papilio xuthus]|uniref:WASH complex subunit strumpellin isoform X1 n=1 Tax=Papilio xuthus TaxID=66420 RepID=A0AAJ7ECZ0_PAPXU|nr:PREDICTED: WASH complex subunit strumpellin isoform X1 [Papilio xuthus]